MNNVYILKTVLAEMTTYSSGEMILQYRGLVRDNFEIDFMVSVMEEMSLFVLVYVVILRHEESLDDFKQLSVMFLYRKLNNDIGPTYTLLFLSITNFSCQVRIFYFLFNCILYLYFLLKNIKFFYQIIFSSYSFLTQIFLYIHLLITFFNYIL